MRVHNIIEEEVFARVKSLYEQASSEKTHWLTCACQRCQTDTACYVLNRIKPKYIVSGRGAAYTTSTIDRQLIADLDSLIIEGMQKVSAAKRPFHSIPLREEENKNIFVYVFPLFAGSIFEAESFEPLKTGVVTLKLGTEPARVIDESWSNPFLLNEKNAGNYSFCLAPEEVAASGEKKVFSFELQVSSEGYEPMTKIVTIPLTSEPYAAVAGDSMSTVKIPDIFLSPV